MYCFFRMRLANNMKRLFQKCQYQLLTKNDLNKNLLLAEYAVRGEVPTKASEYEELLKQPNHGLPFNEITKCNIGNPQELGQQPISFNRQVLSGLINPDLLKSEALSEDAKNRVKFYIKHIKGNVGAYSDSCGYEFSRKSVAKFIQNRDGLEKAPDYKKIILTDGASQGVHMMIFSLISNTTDGVMIPIPQYPLYSATITLNQGKECHYYLDEDNEWQVTKQELERSYLLSEKQGIKPKTLVIINPGNPTGQVMSEETIKQFIEFAYEKKLVIIADEVYQDNIYTENKFYSFNKVRMSMPEPYRSIELLSFHSTSKGLLGECGFRGGYIHIENFSEEVMTEIIKLRSISLCSNTIGQCLTELMCNPPSAENGASEETILQYQQERKNHLDSLKLRANILYQSLQLTNMTCNIIQGAMYAFPQVTFSKKFIEYANQMNKSADILYCLMALEKTGIVIVPGSGFKQKKNTYHFRTTTLILPEQKLKQKWQDFKIFNEWFHNQYKDQ